MSRFKHTNHSRKVRKDSRTIPVPGHQDYGDGEDNGKWFRCWNCGFLCNKDRDFLGNADDRPGVTATAYTKVDQYGDTAFHCVGGIGATQVLCEADGGTWTSTGYMPVVEQGCPFCGCVNWRGDY